MDFSTKYCIIIYVIILLLLYLWKPFLFKITDENPDKKKQKAYSGPTEIRTQVAGIKNQSDNQLHYGTFFEILEIV